MRRSSSIITRKTHSSSISRQAQMLPIIPTTGTPPPLPSPGIRSAKPTPGSSGGERVKEWVDIFDGPMRPAVFVSPSTQSSSPIREADNGVNSSIFDGPARPRYIIPGSNIHPSAISTQSKSRNETGPPTTQRNDVSALLSRSSLPPPRIYDGPAFEWELQTKRV